MQELKFFIFGDSICFGQFVSPHLTWVTTLAKELHEKILARSVIVNNASINGNTTRQALERMPYDIQSHAPHFLLVQFGMNDCNYWRSDCGLPRVSPRAFEANLGEIVDRAFVCGVKCVFLNTNHPTPINIAENWAPRSYQESNARYNTIIRSVCDRLATNLPVALIDVEKAWLKRLDSGVDLNDLVLDDGLHLSEKGHQIYRNVVVSKVVQTVTENT
jgi:lysophospholipase L1-like esterase